MKERDFLQLVERADRRFFAEAANRLAAPERFAQTQKGNGRVMKQKRHFTRKYVWGGIGFAAALLTIGGTAAVVAWRGQDGQYNSIDMTDRVEEVTPLHLNLTDDEYTPASENGWSGYVTIADYGWYYYRDRWVIPPTAVGANPDSTAWETWLKDDEYIAYMESRGFGMLYYTDAETGASVPFCARANCLHNGDEFCPASTEQYIHTELTYYDGKLYAFAAKNTGQVDENGIPDYDGCYLLCYEPDGTGITELARFDSSISLNLYTTGPVLHRGYLFCSFRCYSNKGETIEDPITGEEKEFSSSGYMIMGYELATGKTVTLYSDVPAEDSGENYECPRFLTAAGDYLYYTIPTSTSWVAKNLAGVYSIDLRTGDHKKLDISEYSTNICPAKNGLLYYVSYAWHWYDLETGESTKLDADSTTTHAVTDGSYIYRVREEADDEQLTSYIEICDMDMQPIAATEYGKNLNLEYIRAKDGYFYVMETGSVCKTKDGKCYYSETGGTDDYYRCRIEDLLNGQAQWEYLLTQEEIEVYGGAE